MHVTSFLKMKAVVYYVLHLVIQAGTCRMFSSDNEDSDKYTHIGIDLGTSYSCVGVFKNGKENIIPDEHENRCIASCVAFTEDGRLLVGDAARRQLTSNPETTICDVKRFIGRIYGDSSVEDDIKSRLYPFLIFEKGSKVYFEVKTAEGLKRFVPEEITAMILGKLKEMAEEYLGRKVYNVVVTVPAYFNIVQRTATRDAAIIAGFKEVRLMNEPSVAAIAHWNARQDVHPTMIVFDLGGGTFDVSLIEFDEGMFTVVATKGNTHLGGKDFDQRVMNHFFDIYKEKTGKEIKKDRLAVQKLRREVERAKIELSSATQVRLEIESFLDGHTFNETLTRAEFEDLNMDLFVSMIVTLKSLLKDANFMEEVDDIVLVGGSTRIPKIQHLVTEFFKGKKPSQNVDPSEAVAIGVTIQAGILSHDEQKANIVFTDVNTFSVVFFTASRSVQRLIQRRTVLPATTTEILETVTDNEISMTLEIFEGDSLEAKDDHHIGRYNFCCFEPAPRGFISIDWIIEIDLSGNLKICASDTRNKSKQADTVIENCLHSLSTNDIKSMTMAIQELKEKDRKCRDREKTREGLEKYIYSLKHRLRDEQELGSMLKEKDKVFLSEFLEENILWLDNNPNVDIAYLKIRIANLDEVIKRILGFSNVKTAEGQDKKDETEKDEL